MFFRLLTSVLFFFLIVQPFFTRIDAEQVLSELETSGQRRSDLKTSKFLFSTNVVFEAGGLNEKFFCLADCLRKASTDEENEDIKKPTCDSELLKNMTPERLTSNKIMQANKTLSNTLLENIGLNKPTKAASFIGADTGASYLSRNGNDGDQLSFYHSILIQHPWWMVELGNTYKIVKISFYSRPNSGPRSVGVQFYVADHIPFLCSGIPDISNLTLFGERIAIPIGTEKSDHEAPEGHYGSKVLAFKPTHSTYLEINELQINGYLYA